jgi:hypothetical protein
VKAGDRMSRGLLVDDALVCDMLAERMQQPDCAGCVILDGFPRSVAQAEWRDKGHPSGLLTSGLSYAHRIFLLCSERNFPVTRNFGWSLLFLEAGYGISKENGFCKTSSSQTLFFLFPSGSGFPVSD